MTNYDNSLDQIAYIKMLIEKTLNQSVTMINSDYKDLTSNTVFNHEIVNEIDFNHPISNPQIKLHSLSESFIIIHYIKKNKLIGTFIVGPISYENTSLNQLIHQAMLIYYLLYQKELSFEAVLEANFYSTEMFEEIEDKFQTDFTHLRIHDHIDGPFIPLYYERELLSYVKHGNTNKLIEIIDKLVPNQSTIDYLNENPIQILQAMLTTLMVLSIRSAITGGLPTALAYKLITYYLNQIQKTSTIHQLNQLKITILMDITSQMKQINKTKISRPISDTIFYIEKNLYQNISLTDICENLHFNPSYLSRLFKKEMNLTISEFILMEKIEEAKRLLILSDHSILEISILLHFTDQSYFTKSFKKVTGVTPKVYRNQCKLLT